MHQSTEFCIFFHNKILILIGIYNSLFDTHIVLVQLFGIWVLVSEHSLPFQILFCVISYGCGSAVDAYALHFHVWRWKRWTPQDWSWGGFQDVMTRQLIFLKHSGILHLMVSIPLMLFENWLADTSFHKLKSISI